MQTAIEQLKKSDTSSEAKNYKLDIYLQNSPNLYVGVHEDYSFMLNQTNIGNNNNKFYVGQLVKKPDGRYAVFTKWGRVVSSLVLLPRDFRVITVSKLVAKSSSSNAES